MPDVHSEIGGSNVHRVLECPASVRLARGRPQPPESPAAREGTILHAAALTMLQGLGEGAARAVLRADDLTRDSADDLMADVLLPAIEMAQKVIAGRDFTTEDWAAFPGLGGQGGTSDVTILVGGKVVGGLDFKFGRVRVVAAENKQLRYYLAAQIAARGSEVDEFEMAVVQPRSGGLSIDFTSGRELSGFISDVQEAARKVDTAEPVTGDHCRYCPAAAFCPARKAEADEAVEGYETLVANGGLNIKDAAALGAALATARALSGWITDVEDMARHILEHGGMIDGYKMVQHNGGTRQWADEAAAAAAIEAKGGKPWAAPKLIGVPAAEKLGVDVEALTTRGKPSYTVVAADDKRPDARPGAFLSGKAIKL